jgi:PAS domain S-box-containing protein
LNESAAIGLPSRPSEEMAVMPRSNSALLIASDSDTLRDDLRCCFGGSAYDIRVVDGPSDVVHAKGRSSGALILDSALTSARAGCPWRQVALYARSTGLQVLAAVTETERARVPGHVAEWAQDFIVYPLDRDLARRTVDTMLGREAPRERLAGANDGLGAALGRRTFDPSGTRKLVQVLEASRMVFDQMSDAIFVFTREGQVVIANTAACRMLGYDREDVLGRSAGVLFAQMVGVPDVNDLDIRRAMTQFAVPPFSAALQAASGSTIPVSFGTSFLKDDEGNIIGILGVARDVRERVALEEQLRRKNEMLEEEVCDRVDEIRKTEAQHRVILEQVPAAIVCTDEADRIKSYNTAAAKSFGWQDDCLGSTIRDALHCKSCRADKQCNDPALSGNRWVGNCAIPLVDGTTCVMLHSCAAQHDARGALQGTVHVLSDISDPSAPRMKLLRDDCDRVQCDEGGSRSIATCNAKMKRVLDLVAAYSASGSTVLLEGESGTGKDLVAQAIHHNSRRSGGPYVVVNCANLKGHLLDSELFGHVKGAFTGAVSNKLGLIETARGGTLFIDEVGDMPLDVQAMMLRVLESNSYRRLGSTEEQTADARIIAATNKDLGKEVAAGRFREDLFYRLNVLKISLPPLRSRAEDIPLLIESFLLSGGTAKEMSPKATKLLMGYSWPGNIRELRNTVEQARVLSNGCAYITEQHIPARIRRASRAVPDEACERPADALGADRSLEDVEREHIRVVLGGVSGNRTKASRILGISRVTLLSKIKKYKL